MSRFCGSSEWLLRARGIAVVGALVLVGCSSGGGDDTTSEPRNTATTEAGQDPSVGTDGDDDEPTGDEPSTASGEPVSYLPFDADAPDGYRMIPGECKANAEAQAAAEEAGDIDYASPIVFAVPEDWVSRGKGSGGSGGVTGTDVDLRYESISSGDVSIEFEWDQRVPDGMGDEGDERSESFDREYETDGATTMIEYEQAATVSIEDQTVDIFHRDASQDPDDVDGEEYKARLSAFDVPNSLFTPDGVDEYSLVFTITFAEDTDEMNQETVEAIIESINLPTCVWDDLLLFEEVIRQTDLNGDGEVQSMEEWQNELMEGLDDLEGSSDD